MARSATNFIGSLPPLMAGLLLGAAGWLGSTVGGSNQNLEFRPQLVVRPASAEIVTTQGHPPVADDSLAGRFLFDEAGFALELRQKGWPATKSEISEPRGMTTLRASVPKASLAISVKGDKSAKAELIELPKKTKLKGSSGKVPLVAGRHELLVQADGYIPKRLSVNLKPGEAREVAMDLEAIPGFPILGFPSGGALPTLPTAPPANVGRQPPAYAPPPYTPPPRYRAPPVYQPPAPVPRFTPIAPPAEPAGPAPVPMFTPIGD